MGIAFINKKADKFDQQTDEAFENQMASGNLFSAMPEKIQNEYRCNCTTEDLPTVGTLVLLYVVNSKIDVVYQNKPIGSVMAPDASEVREIMEKANSVIMAAQVTEIKLVSKIFLVQLRPS